MEAEERSASPPWQRPAALAVTASSSSSQQQEQEQQEQQRKRPRSPSAAGSPRGSTAPPPPPPLALQPPGAEAASAAMVVRAAPPPPAGQVFATGPRMRVERAYDPATGEHRCLVYRTDRRAPVAKIIWTTGLASPYGSSGNLLQLLGQHGQQQVEGAAAAAAAASSNTAALTVAAPADAAGGGGDGQMVIYGEEAEEEGHKGAGAALGLGLGGGAGGRRRRVAHVKSVFVHESMRGSGLGRLLFYQLFATLRRGGVGLLRLEAEEDVSRHNRLVRFYESLGFRPVEGARVLYLSHYDDYFRKVPMYREVSPCAASPEEIDEGASFMVVVLRSSGGGAIFGDEGGRLGVEAEDGHGDQAMVVRTAAATAAAAASRRPLLREQQARSSSSSSSSSPSHQRIWVLVQDAAGGVSMLENHVGRFLCAEPDGKVVADRAVLSTWEMFELEAYETSSGSSPASSPRASSSASSSGARGSSGSANGSSGSSGNGKREVFAFRTFHGKYLRLAGDGSGEAAAMTTGDEPTLWEVAQQGAGGEPKVITVVRDPEGGPAVGGQGGGGDGGGGGGSRWRKARVQEPKQATVRAVHRKMRRINSVAFVKEMRAKWGRFDAMDRFARMLCEKQQQQTSPQAAASPAPAPAPAPTATAVGGEGAKPSLPPTAAPAASMAAAKQEEEQKEEEEEVVAGLPSSSSSHPSQQQQPQQPPREMTIRDAVHLLCQHLDPLQPELADRGVSYGHTLLWIAEYIRAQGHPDWLQLLGLLHGLGRVIFELFLQARDRDLYEDWAFGGQAWVVGCRIPHTIRYPEVNDLCEDCDDPRYASLHGMYAPHCGMAQVLLNWSGTEYLHTLLAHQPHALPAEALAMVRYVDLDLWHSQPQHRHYDHLMAPGDEQLREAARRFHGLRAEALATLPSWASGARPPVEVGKVWPYYQALVDKYLPAGLRW